MLPSIRPRVHTEALSQNRKRVSSGSIFVNSGIKQSSIKACMPYINQLQYSSNRCSPKLSKLPNKKYNKMFTQVNQTIDCKNYPSYYLTKQTDHDSNDTNTLSDLQVKIRNSIKPKHQSNKITSLLRSFQQIKKNIKQNEKNQSILVINSPKSQKYTKCMNQYQNLSKNKMLWNQNTTQSFIQTLSLINPFVKKLQPIVFLCLLKVGHIKTYQQDELVNWQDEPYSKSIGIILWGEVLIKGLTNKMKIYLFSGDSLNQELIFLKDFKTNSFIQRKQIFKTKSSTAILYLKIRDYRLVYQELVKIGQKSNILLAQNMMKWSYAKKKNTRNQFSHI